MDIPEGMTEAEVVTIIDNIANRLANKFKFGYHETDDMRQQAKIFAMEGLPRYNAETGPLENFLYIHTRNRLANFKRDNYERLVTPCSKCQNRDTKYCTEDCPTMQKWLARNTCRKNIISPVPMEQVRDEHEHTMSSIYDLPAELDNSVLFEKIDRELPVELRQDLIRLKYNCRLSKQKRDNLYSCIKKILEKDT